MKDKNATVTKPHDYVSIVLSILLHHLFPSACIDIACQTMEVKARGKARQFEPQCTCVMS